MTTDRQKGNVLISAVLLAGGVMMGTGGYALLQGGSSNPGHGQAVFRRPRAFTFVQLVFKADMIAAGSVIQAPHGEGPPLVLQVERSFPEGGPRHVRVDLRRGSHQTVPAFTAGEKVVLFLDHLEGDRAVLLGAGDTGKWPRTKADWLFSAGHVCPLAEVVRVVDLLLQIDRLDTYEKRLTEVIRELVPIGSLGRIAAAQYAAEAERWDSARSAGELTLQEVRLIVAGRFLLEGGERDPAVDYAILALLSSAPAAVAIPQLIERLNDADAAVRGTALSSLRTAAFRLTQDTLGYDQNAPADQRAAAIERWRRWWGSVRRQALKEEVPSFLTALESPYPLRRLAADCSLRLISGTTVGFDPNAPAQQREASVRRWRAWWSTFTEPD